MREKPTSGMKHMHDRLIELTEAILRINEDMDYSVVLEEVVHSARVLTGANYGGITVLTSRGNLKNL